MHGRSVGLRPADQMLGWEGMILTLRCCWAIASAAASADAADPLSWLLSDKGPFHRAQEFTEFTERHEHGFSTRYKIYR